MSYVRVLFEWANSHGILAVLATSSDSLTSPEFHLRFPSGLLASQTINLGALADIGGAGYRTWISDSLDQVELEQPNARVLILESDKLLPWISLRPCVQRHKTSVLVMRMPPRIGRRPLRAIDVAKRAMVAVAKFRGVRVLGLSPATAISDSYFLHGYAATPDPVDFATTATMVHEYRTARNMEDQTTWLGIFGNISSRKNVDLAADAIVASGLDRVGLLVAGQISNDELERCTPSFDRLIAAGGRVVVDNRLLTDQEIDAAISSCSIVAVLHSSAGPSGILGKAAAAGAFVITAGPHTLRDDQERLGLEGEHVDLNLRGVAFGLNVAVSRLNSGERRILPVPVPADGTEFARVLIGTIHG